jgi:hypothetical protein
VGEVPIFFYFHIWTTKVIPYNALNSKFTNFETLVCGFKRNKYRITNKFANDISYKEHTKINFLFFNLNMIIVFH